MAALQPSVGGLPFPQRSFADVIKRPMQSLAQGSAVPSPTPDPVHASSDSSKLGTHKGFPAIYLTDARWLDLAKSFQWTLVGKFTQGYNKTHPELGRPPVEKLQTYFQSLDFTGEFSLGLLDNRHLLIRLTSEEDFLRLYSRMIWRIGHVTMRIFKWVPDFHVETESSLVPVWITLPRLPIHLFEKSILFQISSLLGLPLRLDAATASLKRPSVARLQVEIDLLRSRPSQIWIGYGERGGFWQKVEYEKVPSYCQHCWHVGHEEQFCHVHHPELKIQSRESSANLRGKQVLVQSKQQVYVPRRGGATMAASEDLVDNSLEQEVVPRPTAAQRSATGPSSVQQHVPNPQILTDFVTASQPPFLSVTPYPNAQKDKVAASHAATPRQATPGVDAVRSQHVSEVLQGQQSGLQAVVANSSAADVTLIDGPQSGSILLPPSGFEIPAVDKALAADFDKGNAVLEAHSVQSSGLAISQKVSVVPVDATAPVDDTVPVATDPNFASTVSLRGTVAPQSSATVALHLHAPVDPSHLSAFHQPPAQIVFTVTAPSPFPEPSLADEIPELAPASKRKSVGEDSADQQSSQGASSLVTYKSVLVDHACAGVVAREIGFTPTVIAESEPDRALVVFHPELPTTESILNPNATAFCPPNATTMPTNLLGKSTPFHSRLPPHNIEADSDYYPDTIGSGDDQHEDYELTDEHTYDDITDGSEGTHSQKKKDRRKLKNIPTPLTTKEEFQDQSHLLAVRIRKRGRPPGSRNRTFFDVQRTMSTRATRSTSD